jgi:phospholipase/lecithinase/hemolysin
LGYTNNRDACFIQTGSAVGEVQENPECDFSRFVFFDALHPTAVTHERAAGLLQAALPLP